MDAPPFTALADVYDLIMADVEYDDWAAFILDTIRRRGWRGGEALDLGCGTGNASEDMLRVARRKLRSSSFVCQRFQRLTLGRRFALVFSVFDALNNLLTERDFRTALRRVYEHLEPGGFFVFDINTTVGLRDLWDGGRVEGWAEEVYYLWTHRFDEATGLAQVEAYCETERGSFTEVHLERPYDPPQLHDWLEAAGFVGTEALAYPGGRAASPDAARVWMVARRPG
jgi:ubiquinone/menaquinone biosynthesis C-methylase UbiE